MPEAKSPQRRDYERRVNRVMDYIEQHLAEKTSLGTLASVAAFSPYHFHRIFTALVGEPLNAFIRRVRLERSASDLLVYRDRPITEVALDCGFTSSAVFARAFRGRFGMSAGEWRKTGGKSRKTDRKDGQTIGKDGQAAAGGLRYAPPMWVRDASATTKEELMEVRIEDMPAIRAAYVRRIGDYNTEAGKAWQTLCQWAGPRRLLGPNTLFFSISHDDPDITPRERLRYDACLAVGPEVKPDGEVGVLDLPARRVARGRYEGPAKGIAQAWKALYRDWLPDSGFAPADSPAIEIYLDQLGNDPEHDKFVMDICIPIVPA